MPESMQIRKDYFTILTVREVAEYLRLSEAKVYRLANERRLPAIRIGKSWRFRKDLLDNWLSQRTESGMDADKLMGIARKNAQTDGDPRE